MHGSFLVVVGWLRHFDGVKLLLEASLLQVGHEHGQVVGGTCERSRLVGATCLPLHLVGRDVVMVRVGLVYRRPYPVQELLVG